MTATRTVIGFPLCTRAGHFIIVSSKAYSWTIEMSQHFRTQTSSYPQWSIIELDSLIGQTSFYDTCSLFLLNQYWYRDMGWLKFLCYFQIQILLLVAVPIIVVEQADVTIKLRYESSDPLFPSCPHLSDTASPGACYSLFSSPRDIIFLLIKGDYVPHSQKTAS